MSNDWRKEWTTKLTCKACGKVIFSDTKCNDSCNSCGRVEFGILREEFVRKESKS